jgi:hypothetical protein
MMIAAEAMLAVFLLIWLNSRNIESFFSAPKNSQISPSPD